MTIPGLHRMLTQMVANFTSFAPLGTVLVAMLGIGIAEGSGLIAAALRLLVISALLITWMLLGLPVGPGAPLFLPTR
jgi:p-aminobenzoyl-glutamate transporter AbgT